MSGVWWCWQSIDGIPLNMLPNNEDLTGFEGWECRWVPFDEDESLDDKLQALRHAHTYAKLLTTWLPRLLAL